MIVNLLVPTVVFVIWDTDVFYQLIIGSDARRVDDSEEHREAVDPPLALKFMNMGKDCEVIYGEHSKATVPSGEVMNWRKHIIFTLL